MREAPLSARDYRQSWLAVSLSIKVSLIPGITVSLGLPYRGERPVIPTVGYRRALVAPSDCGPGGFAENLKGRLVGKLP